jgi:hypothetical protein
MVRFIPLVTGARDGNLNRPFLDAGELLFFVFCTAFAFFSDTPKRIPRCEIRAAIVRTRDDATAYHGKKLEREKVERSDCRGGRRPRASPRPTSRGLCVCRAAAREGIATTRQREQTRARSRCRRRAQGPGRRDGSRAFACGCREQEHRRDCLHGRRGFCAERQREKLEGRRIRESARATSGVAVVLSDYHDSRNCLPHPQTDVLTATPCNIFRTPGPNNLLTTV